MATRRRRRWRPVLLALLLPPLAVLSLYTGLLAWVWWYGTKSDPAPADAAVVLGAASWNGRPSPVFKARIDHAVELYQRGQVRALVFTGGHGGDRFTEGETGRDYALGQGVPAAVIHVEKASTTTYENLLGARPLLERHGLRRVLLVSDPPHMRRAVAMARDLGIDAHPSPTRYSVFATWETRRPFLFSEALYYGLYLLRRVMDLGDD